MQREDPCNSKRVARNRAQPQCSGRTPHRIAPNCDKCRAQTKDNRSCVLEVWVEDVWTATAHLRTFNIRRACVELVLVPLALASLIPPLHALLRRKLWVCLVLVYLEAPELFNLQVLARIFGIVCVKLVREILHGHSDIVTGLGSLVLFRHIYSMVIRHGFLPIGGIIRLRCPLNVQMTGDVVLVSLIDLFLCHLQIIRELKCLREWALSLLMLLVFRIASLFVHLRAQWNLLRVLGKSNWMRISAWHFTSHLRVPHCYVIRQGNADPK